jgi:FixJ family two-component response regulator
MIPPVVLAGQDEFSGCARTGAPLEERPRVSPAVVSIVDDDAAVLAATTRLLRLHGFLVHAFSSAAEFLRSPFVDKTSCLITDMMMPGMSGAALQHELIARGYRVPIIFISAYRQENRVADARAAGAVAFLTKPFDGQTLIGYVTEALNEAGHGAPCA